MKKPDLGFLDQTIDTEFGQRVNVRRTHLDETEADKKIGETLNGVLHGLGHELNFKTKDMDYMGSMATHIYASKILRQVFYVHQNCLLETPEIVASKAFEDLRGTVMESYGRKRPKKRSGF